VGERAGNPGRSSARGRWHVAGARKPIIGIAVGLLGLHLALGIAGEGRQLAELIAVAIEAAAALAIAIRAATSRADRAAWWFLAIGVGAWAVGDGIYWWASATSAEDIYPPVVEVIYAVFYVCTAVALVLFVRSSVRTARVAAAAIVAGLALAMSWSWLIFSNVDSVGDVSANLAAVTYPILDLSLVAALVICVAHAGRPVPRALPALGASFLLTAIGDATVAAEAVSDGYVPAAWINSFWPIAVVLLAVAAWIPGTFLPSRRLEAALTAVVLALAGGSGLVALVWDHYERLDGVTFALATLTLVAAMVAALVLQDRYRRARAAVSAAHHDLSLRSQLLDQVDAAVVATDLEGRIIFWSDGAERLLGWTREQAIGKRSVELGAIRPDQEDELAEVRERARNGETLVTELQIRTAKRRTFDGLYTISPLRDSSGELIGTAGVTVDLTEKKQIERNLAARVKQQGIVAELGRLAAIERDVDFVARAAAESVRRTLGVEFVKVLEIQPQAEAFTVRGSSGWDPAVLENRTIPLADSHAGYALRAGAPVVFEDLRCEERFQGSELLREEGATSGVAVAIHGANGPQGVIAAHSRNLREFTDDELAFIEGVANVVAAAITRERADQLSDQLRQAQKLEDVGRLAGGVAHDFNNLLALILNYVTFVHDELPAGRQRSDLGEALKATRSAAELTERLLLFSRQDVREPRAIDLNEAIEDMVALLDRTLGEDVVLESRLSEEVGPVTADPSEIQQVLLNLAVNARDAMPDGGRLRVETTRVELGEDDELSDLPAGPYVRLSVGDTGSGMSEEVRRRAFDPFFTTKAAGHGTGLGLGIVDSVARQSGGRAFLESAPNEGTTVSLLLPVTTDKPGSEHADAHDESGPGRGETVLVVEDDAALRRLAERILRRGGYVPVVAGSAGEALERSREYNGELSLLLTDIVMPEMSGVELANRLRATHPEVAIAFVSGYTGDIVADDFPDGSVTLIDKPFDAETLLTKVREAVASRG
jgi:two-component system, cell cycle sensor histidine kinase and response regulator CckA